MSDIEHIRGKLIPVTNWIDFDGDATMEDKCKAVMQHEGISKQTWHESWREAFNDECYRKFYIHANNIYKVEGEELDADEDIYRSSANSDGSFEFEVKYYKGGCSFDEAIGEALNDE